MSEKMNKKYKAISVFIIFLSMAVFAEDPIESRLSEINEIYPGFSVLWNHMKKLPSDSGNIKGLEVWFNLVGINKFSSEKEMETDLPGIKNYIETKLKEDSQFKQQLYELYLWLKKQDEKYAVSEEDVYLGEETGKGKFINFKPGFLWSELLRLGHQSPREALQILAATLADPKGSLDLSMPMEYFLTDSQKTDLNKLKEDLKKLPSRGKDFMEIREKMNKIYDQMNFKMSERNKNAHVQFSKNKILILPKNLGENVDISDALKQKIKTNINVGSLYAKYYHIQLAAFMSCEMLSAGMNTNLTLMMQKWTAWGYRTVKLNLYLKKLFRKRSENQDLTESEKVDLLASKLMENWFTGAKMGSHITRPYTNLNLTDFVFSEKYKKIPDVNENSSLKSSLSGFPKPLFMDEAEFKLAKERLRLWLTEWEWTIAQHEIGSQLAIANCRDPK